MDRVAAAETERCSRRCSTGCSRSAGAGLGLAEPRRSGADGGVHDRRRRTRATQRSALAAERIAVWDGHNYAVECVDQLGLADSGGVIRAGVVRYIDDDDVQRLLRTVDRLATTHR